VSEGGKRRTEETFRCHFGGAVVINEWCSLMFEFEMIFGDVEK
jgi:hypothetical protein